VDGAACAGVSGWPAESVPALPLMLSTEHSDSSEDWGPLTTFTCTT
jgi:hypothetical protein